MHSLKRVIKYPIFRERANLKFYKGDQICTFKRMIKNAFLED